MGYWIIIWFTIVLEEALLFNKGEYDWSAWNNPQKLPVGYAATAAFLIGWAGAIVGMVGHPNFLLETVLLLTI